MTSFHPFGLTHLLALAAIAALISLLVRYARRLRTAERVHLEHVLAAANALVWLVAHTWWMLPPRFDPATSLPLHMCHVMAIVASVALIAPKRWLSTLLYFWGIGLCTQALITPSLEDGPASLWFWTFWLEHGFLLGIAVYDVAVRRYRPTWRDYGVACAAAFVYLAVVLPIDIAFDSDYGFVGRPTPRNPTLLDVLGAWPQRIVWIVLIVAAAMALLMLPWSARRKLHGTQQ